MIDVAMGGPKDYVPRRCLIAFLRVALSATMLATILVVVFRSAAAVESSLIVAKYYAWFDQDSWNPAQLPDRPLAPYVSAERATIERQVREAKGAGIDAFSLNWLGPGNPTDTNLQTLLSVAGGVGFLTTVDVDLDSPFIRNAGDVVNSLNYLKRYFADRAWLRYDGKPVVVFYGIRKYEVDTWAIVRSMVDPDRAALWIGEGDVFSYLSVFDGIHPYSIAWATNPAGQLAGYAAKTRAVPGKLWVATVMPGYDDTRAGRGAAGYARDRENGTYYRQTWEGAIATRPAMIVITSWNEWAEGSHIEPSVGHGDLYLRLTGEYSDQFKNGGRPSPAPAGRSGRFFAKAGQGRGGYFISDEGSMAFLSAFDALGGAETIGYPSSRRFRMSDGFTYQATQGGLLQWRPELGRAVLANAFEILQAAGKDDWLDQVKGIPRPIADDGSQGNWERATETRLSWLTDEVIRGKYLELGSVSRAIELHGLPMSRPEKRGPFIVQRFQRAVLQRWVEAVPGMPPPGTIVRVLGGDLLKEAGIIPAAAAQPEADL